MSYGISDYPYLEIEDAQFCQCFRLTESQFLEMLGGLRGYTEHRLNRSKARGAQVGSGADTLVFDVPQLPSDMKKALEIMKFADVKEDRYAQYLVNEQREKVQGIMDALKADARLKALQASEAKERQSQKEHALQELARRNPYGWKADSQSAKNWAEAEYERRQRR